MNEITTLDFSQIEVKRAFRHFINQAMHKKHMLPEHLAKSCDIRTVERYFKGPESAMPKRISAQRVYNFLDAVGHNYNDFYEYYKNTINDSDKTYMGRYLCPLIKRLGTSWLSIGISTVICVAVIFVAVIFMPWTITTIRELFEPQQSSLLSFKAIAPTKQSFCQEQTLFRSGVTVLKKWASLHSGDCFAVTLQWDGRGELFLLTEKDGQLLRLFPDDCNAIGYQGVTLTAGEWHFPLNDDGTATMFQLDSDKGQETLLALNVDVQQISEQQRQAINNLPTTCSASKHLSKPITFTQLNELGSKLWQQNKDWRSITIFHQ